MFNSKDKDRGGGLDLKIHTPGALNFRGSVVLPTVKGSLVATLWSVLITCLHLFVTKLSMPSTYISTTSFVMSLLLAFKNNSSYEKYNEGRKLWSQLLTLSRNLGRLIWIGIEDPEPKATEEKRVAMYLVLAFFIAAKNHIRGKDGIRDEHGILRPELAGLIPAKKQAALDAAEERRGSTASALPLTEIVVEGAAADGSGPAAEVTLQVPDAPAATRGAGSLRRPSKTAAQYGFFDGSRGNLALDVTHMLSAYFSAQLKKTRTDSSQYGGMITTLNTMTEVVTSLERVATSRIPYAYIIHLKQIIAIFLILLPFQIVEQFKGWTPALVFLIAFTFLGVDAIGSEIELPFGDDPNDLKIDVYVEQLKWEFTEIVKTPRAKLNEWDLLDD
ncbi:hypothetical protein GGF32_000856 [Allomyces javanicus]|nr:hypothetical protein GGF32_000856 [Allomyces javanicus]